MRVALLTTDNREHLRTYDLVQPRFGPAIEALIEGLAKVPDIETHVVTCTQRTMRSPERLADNVHFHSLLVPKFGWLRTGYQGCVRAIRRKLEELHPDIVHGQGTERECALGAVFSGFPNVVTIHGNMNQVAKAMRARIGGYFWCAAALERFALPRTHGVFCNSAYTEAIVRQYSCRTWRVPNAIRKVFFAKPQPSASPTKAKILNIGVVAAYKRQNELLDVAERLRGEGLPFEIEFIGAADASTPYASTFLRRIESAARVGFARHVGTKSASELIACLDAASALVHVPAEEAFGLVVAEALARNLKFFGAEVGGIPDIARGVEGAELFSLRDDAVLRAAITQWIHSGFPRPRSAAAEMRARYEPEKIAQRHREIYEEVIASHPLA